MEMQVTASKKMSRQYLKLSLMLGFSVILFPVHNAYGYQILSFKGLITLLIQSTYKGFDVFYHFTVASPNDNYQSIVTLLSMIMVFYILSLLLLAYEVKSKRPLRFSFLLKILLAVVSFYSVPYLILYGFDDLFNVGAMGSVLSLMTGLSLLASLYYQQREKNINYQSNNKMMFELIVSTVYLALVAVFMISVQVFEQIWTVNSAVLYSILPATMLIGFILLLKIKEGVLPKRFALFIKAFILYAVVAGQISFYIIFYMILEIGDFIKNPDHVMTVQVVFVFISCGIMSYVILKSSSRFKSIALLAFALYLACQAYIFYAVRQIIIHNNMAIAERSLVSWTSKYNSLFFNALPLLVVFVLYRVIKNQTLINQTTEENIESVPS